MSRIAIHGRFRQQSANGIDRTIAGHLRALADRGHEVELISFFEPSGNDRKYLDEKKIKIRIIKASLYGSFIGFWRLRGRFDLVMLHSVFVIQNWIAVLALGSKWTMTPHGGYSPGQIRYRRSFAKRLALFVFESYMLRQALAVHVLSENEAKQVQAVAPGSVTIVAPNGADTDMDAFPPAEFRNVLRLLFIGRVECMHKGLDKLVEGISKLKNELVGLRLDIVGPANNQDREILEATTKKFPHWIEVVFHGAIFGEHKLDLIRKSHVFVHTSRWEGLPFAVIEALQYGRPVFITPETNLGSLVSSYEAGWVVDLERIEEGLQVLLRISPHELERRSRNAARLARVELPWDKVGEKLFGHMEKLLDQDS